VWPPFQENYVWEALQGAVAQAEILNRFGFDTYNWSSRALLRAVALVACGGWLSCNRRRQLGAAYRELPIRNDVLCTGSEQPGKNVGFSDWTHGPGRVRAAPHPCRI
jgi:hypothetical protein